MAVRAGRCGVSSIRDCPDCRSVYRPIKSSVSRIPAATFQPVPAMPFGHDARDPEFVHAWNLLIPGFAAARTSADDLRSLRVWLNGLSVAALAADSTGRYVAVNRAAAEMIGYSI